MDGRPSLTSAPDPMRASQILTQLRDREPRYDESAYLFLLAALRRCMDRLDQPRHVSGPELARSARELALHRYGPLARTVLEHWGIQSTSDLGEIVFLLVDCGVLTKLPSDTREDFEDVYTFDEAFGGEYPWGALGEGRPA